GDRIGGELGQMVRRIRVAPVLEQLGERARVLLVLLVEGLDGLAVLVAAEKELGLLFALRGVRGHLAIRGEPRPHGGDHDHGPHEGEALLLLTSVHTPWPRCARRTRRPFARRWAARRSRSRWSG